MAHCPECEALVDLDADEVEEGEIVSCPDCGTDLEVMSTNPMELRLAEEDDLDEDEEDDEDELLDEDEEDKYEK